MTLAEVFVAILGLLLFLATENVVGGGTTSGVADEIKIIHSVNSNAINSIATKISEDSYSIDCRHSK